MKLGDEIACSGCGDMFVPSQVVVWRINGRDGKNKNRVCKKSCISRKYRSLSEKKEATRRNDAKYRTTEKYKLYRIKWGENNREKLRCRVVKWRGTEKGKEAQKRKNDRRMERHNSDPEYRDRERKLARYNRSKRNYGDYAEAHRALCQIRNQLKETTNAN